MVDVTIPIILTVAALITALAAYRGIRRGGAPIYTLERESMLRRASFTLLASMLLFLGAVSLLVYGNQQLQAPETTDSETVDDSRATATPAPILIDQPPTPTASPTVDPNQPTPTATPIICRAIVDGTAGSGLTLRDAPSGAEVAVLPDGSIVTLLESDPVEANGFVWYNIRSVAREEGWVAEDFLRFGECR